MPQKLLQVRICNLHQSKLLLCRSQIIAALKQATHRQVWTCLNHRQKLNEGNRQHLKCKKISNISSNIMRSAGERPSPSGESRLVQFSHQCQHRQRTCPICDMKRCTIFIFSVFLSLSPPEEPRFGRPEAHHVFALTSHDARLCVIVSHFALHVRLQFFAFETKQPETRNENRSGIGLEGIPESDLRPWCQGYDQLDRLLGEKASRWDILMGWVGTMLAIQEHVFLSCFPQYILEFKNPTRASLKHGHPFCRTTLSETLQAKPIRSPSVLELSRYCNGISDSVESAWWLQQ